MSRAFFAADLDSVATYWRIFRRDGVTLGFTAHDRDLWFGGIKHSAAPGMLPSAIRKTSSLSDDTAEMTGVLSHGTIDAEDLRSGRFDYARIEVGAADWQGLDVMPLYFGSIGLVSIADEQFTAELRSNKADLDQDIIPRTSPTCRASFCGPGCTLSAFKYSRIASVIATDTALNAVAIDTDTLEPFVGGRLRWLDGPAAGQSTVILAAENDHLMVMEAVPHISSGIVRVQLIEGCDHRLVTCATRFDNAVNFQAEPFLPGNDLLVRSPVPE